MGRASPVRCTEGYARINGISTRLVQMIVIAFFGGLLGSSAQGQQQLVPRRGTAIVAPLHTSPANKVLGEAVSEILTVALADHKSLIILDRSSLDKILAEQQLGLQGLIDPATAARVGKLLAADIVIAGSIVEVDGNLHYSIQAIAVDSRRVIGVANLRAPRANFDKTVFELSKKIADATGVKLPQIRPDQIDDSPVGRLHLMRAVSLYHEGNPNDAIVYCLRAVRLDPRLVEARLWIARCYLRLNERKHALAELRLLARNKSARELMPQILALLKEATKTED